MHSSNHRTEKLAVLCIHENGVISNWVVTCGLISGLEAIIGLEATWISMISPMGVETTGRSMLFVIQRPWFKIYVRQVFCFIDHDIAYTYIYHAYM